ncbi:MAG: CopG family transcriptional regulator [Desulfurococcaceae archaeon]
MTSKRRFGISVPNELADCLDRATELVGHDRSTIVTKALEEYLHEDLHEREEHNCVGLLIYSGNVPARDLYSSEFGRVVKGFCSMVLTSGRVTVLFVEGDYSKIRSLRRKLSGTAELTRYVPLTCQFKGQKRREY